MKILTFNCGSSSLKYKLIDMPSETELVGGEAQRVGPKTKEPSRIVHRVNGKEEVILREMPSLAIAFQEVMKLLESRADLAPEAVGHRMVHGASIFKSHVLSTPQVLATLRSLQHLAPLHNPPALDVAEACQQRYSQLPQSIIIDTAFHSGIPEHAYTYPIPAALSQELGIRKYGFHGISHQYAVQEAAKLLNKPMEKVNLVCCHLGSGGASLCAVRNGQSVDNTMGYSPLQGLVMSTRSGDLDPALTLTLLGEAGGNYKNVNDRLNKKSGVLGLSGVSGDIRDILKINLASPAPQTELTAQLYTWRIRKYLGSYLAVAGPVDAVTFTDTIGELVPQVRWEVCADLEMFGIKMDSALNQKVDHYPMDIATADSPVRLFVILANEELAIARRTYEMVSMN